MASLSPRSWLKSWRPASRAARGRTHRTVARLNLESLEDRQLLATFTVTNANNAGAGSLRQAILNANGTFAADVIQFRVGTGPKDLIPTARLPEIIHPVVLDGTTQPGYSGTPLITIMGQSAGQFAEGLVLRTRDSTVRALTIRSFNGHGIVVYGTSNTIERCYIGIDPFQTFGAGNRDAGVAIEGGDLNVLRGNGLSGVMISGIFARANHVGGTFGFAGNHIGTDQTGTVAVPNGQNGVWIGNGASGNNIGNPVFGGGPSRGNVISGNNWAGVAIFHRGTFGNSVAGNRIGTNATGTAALGNNEGVYVAQGAESTRIGGGDDDNRNIISGNRNEGVVLRDAGTRSTFVVGNFIGTNTSGTAAVPNQKDGVFIGNGASGNYIGDAIHFGTRGRNIISGNNWSGVALFHSGTTGNYVESNYIGTNAAGTAALGNLDGVQVAAGASGNFIGGSDVGAGNVIAANRRHGVLLWDSGTNGNAVRGNYSGFNADSGVAIGNGASANIIGGTATGDANVIAYNGNHGVGTVAGGRNLLRGNAIFENGALGIDVDYDWVTFAHIVWLTGASTSGPSTTVEGWVIGAPNATYTVELFENVAADPFGFGEGEAPLPGLHTVSTDADGYGYLLATLPFPMEVGRCVSATATEADGTTWEFGNCLPIVASGSPSVPGRDAALAPRLAEASPLAAPQSREHLGTEATTLRAEWTPFRDHRPDDAAADASFGGAAPPRPTATAFPGEDGPLFWEWVPGLDES